MTTATSTATSTRGSGGRSKRGRGRGRGRGRRLQPSRRGLILFDHSQLGVGPFGCLLASVEGGREEGIEVVGEGQEISEGEGGVVGCGMGGWGCAYVVEEEVRLVFVQCLRGE